MYIFWYILVENFKFYKNILKFLIIDRLVQLILSIQNWDGDAHFSSRVLYSKLKFLTNLSSRIKNLDWILFSIMTVVNLWWTILIKVYKNKQHLRNKNKWLKQNKINELKHKNLIGKSMSMEKDHWIYIFFVTKITILF